MIPIGPSFQYCFDGVGKHYNRHNNERYDADEWWHDFQIQHFPSSLPLSDNIGHGIIDRPLLYPFGDQIEEIGEGVYHHCGRVCQHGLRMSDEGKNHLHQNKSQKREEGNVEHIFVAGGGHCVWCSLPFLASPMRCR